MLIFCFFIVNRKETIYGIVYVPAKIIVIMGTTTLRRFSAIPIFAIEIIEPNMVIKEIGIGSAKITNKIITNDLFFILPPC